MKLKADDERRETASLEELREELARQILLIALNDSNSQLKVDIYKATARPPDRTKQTDAAPSDMMQAFRARVSKASQSVNEDEDGADDPEPAA